MHLFDDTKRNKKNKRKTKRKKRLGRLNQSRRGGGKPLIVDQSQKNLMVDVGIDVKALSAPLTSILNSPPSFIDLFAGCGGLSLGLMQAGWRGLFAVEKTGDAFKTLKANLVNNFAHKSVRIDKGHLFDWPDGDNELGPPKAWDINELIALKKDYLKSLDGDVDLLAGGPPCQGFSFAGRRKSGDPRNQLFEKYLEFVELVRPKLLLIENVKGIGVSFQDDESGKSYADKIKNRLGRLEPKYEVKWFKVQSSEYGIPQERPRKIMFGVRVDLLKKRPNLINGFDAAIRGEGKKEFFKSIGLKKVANGGQTSVEEALSDLLCGKAKEHIESYTPEPDEPTFPGIKKFKQISYDAKRFSASNSDYFRYVRNRLITRAPNSLRLANHNKSTTLKFELMQKEMPRGTTLNSGDKLRLETMLKASYPDFFSGGFKIKKQSMVILDGRKTSHTLTTLPDDFLHFSEPRILTVREYARLQSFPDWFDFKGKYTTGGNRRKEECPRYTQVGNAVPPLLARYIGNILLNLMD